MAMDAQDLARKLHDALSQKKDGYGKPTPISAQTMSYAQGIVDALKAAVVANASGTITGTCPPGGPLGAGAGINGTITMTPNPMSAKTCVGVPPKAIPNIRKENAAIIAYIATAKVVFAPGSITGTCTNSGASPGALTGGAGTNGTLTLITGAGATAAVAAALGKVGPEALKHYTTLINWVIANAKAAYASGKVTGTCPAGGGALTLGTGITGTIS